jgi:hypothetical protein
MNRTRPTIYLEDEVFMREAAVRRDPIFHETPINTLRDSARKHSPTPSILGQTRIKVGLIWLYGMKFRELLHRCHVWHLGAI